MPYGNAGSLPGLNTAGPPNIYRCESVRAASQEPQAFSLIDGLSCGWRCFCLFTLLIVAWRFFMVHFLVFLFYWCFFFLCVAFLECCVFSEVRS